MDSNDANPYASPQTVESAVVSTLADQTQEELIRREHLNREVSIQSIGLLCYVGAFLFTLVIVLTMSAGTDLLGVWPPNLDLLLGLAVVLVCAVLAALHGWVGHGLRRLRPKVRPFAYAISLLWMFYLIWGTIFGIYALVMLSGEKGRYVFSDEYREIIDATPHVKYRTSRATWIVLGVLVAVLALLFALGMIVAIQN